MPCILGGGGGNVDTAASRIRTSVDGETAGGIDRLRAAATAGALLTVALAAVISASIARRLTAGAGEGEPRRLPPIGVLLSAMIEK